MKIIICRGKEVIGASIVIGAKLKTMMGLEIRYRML
jgi:hypothetical protein